jgi:hypothetical protein
MEAIYSSRGRGEAAVGKTISANDDHWRPPPVFSKMFFGGGCCRHMRDERKRKTDRG